MQPDADEGNKAMLAEAATAIDLAADELLKAAKLIERIGWSAALGNAKGHPIELWGNDEALQELADRLKGIVAEMAPKESEAE
jgi:hypothetical protein